MPTKGENKPPAPRLTSFRLTAPMDADIAYLQSIGYDNKTTILAVALHHLRTWHEAKEEGEE